MATQSYISYRAQYKYQLADDYEQETTIEPKSDIKTEFIDLNVNGKLLVKSVYAWDGPSGPVIDTEENMRASLVHDALYQLIRNKELSTRTHRRAADKLFRDMCKKDGVSNLRASIYYKALRKYGKPAASPQNKKQLHRAPKEEK